MTTDYAEFLREAIVALAMRDSESACGALSPIAGLTWSERLTCRQGSGMVGTAPVHGSKKRTFSRARSAATFARDGYTCVYCGIRVVARPVAVLLHDICPETLPYHVHYKHGFIHPLFWTNVAEADHLVPGSTGGSWDDLANHVTACSRCNAVKGDAEAGPMKPTPPRPGDWDGLVPLYRLAWVRAGRPRSQYHESWIRVLERATADQARH